jgi:hypothetical protein
LGRHIVIRIAYLDCTIFLVHDGLLASDKLVGKLEPLDERA